MSSIRPRIAVLIPSYNAEQTIGKALASLITNSEPHDIIIVDDGSGKALRECLTPQDNMTILRLDPNGGITNALNHGLKYIIGQGYEYVARLDADDAASPDRLAVQRAFLDEHPEVVLVGGWGQIVSEQDEILFYLNHPTSHQAILRGLRYNSPFLHPTLMIRTKVFPEAGMYSDAYPGAEDFELVSRLSRRAKLANMPKYLVRYTVSPGGISVAKRRRILRSRLRVQWVYRDFADPHFYFGILKTLVLMCVPMDLIAAIKQKLPAYKQR